jgi:hypothetical protein
MPFIDVEEHDLVRFSESSEIVRGGDALAARAQHGVTITHETS